MTSIEFRNVGAFTSPFFSTQKSARRAVREGVVTASVTLFVPQRSILFVGLTDGNILCFETDWYLTEKRANDGRIRTLSEHKGNIRCMHFAEGLCQGVMFTGSADRCIKMWDLSDPRIAIPCVHSLYGHGSTVLAVEFGADLLLSSSTDGSMCVWRDQSPVKLLRFPAYSIRQKICPDTRALAAPGSGRNSRETWFLSISIREGEAPSIFAGDSEGFVHLYRPDMAQGDDRDVIFLLAWKVKVHDLGISRILAVPMESFVFTTSFDQKFKVLDSPTGQVIFEECNQCGVVFNGLSWDPVCQDVIVADDRGNIGFYNLYTESCVVWKNVSRDQVTQIHYEPSTHRLLLLSPHVLRVLDVVRGVKFSELNEHTGPIVGMAARSTPEGGLLYSAAMDNTIRMWDTDTLECIKTMKEKKNEITAMVHLPRANVIVTGHENSDLKMWSLDSQEEAYLRTVTGQSVHGNTISALIWAASSSVDMAQQRAMDSLSGDFAGFEMLIAGSYDRQLSFWKITLTSDGTAMAKFERSFLAHDDLDDEILCVAHSPAANAVFTGGNAGIIRKWGLYGVRQKTAEYGSDGKGHQEAVVCFATDGNFLYSGSEDRTIRIWETLQGYELKVVEVHSVTVQALLVIPESRLVASCGFDGRVVFWDPQISKADSSQLQTYEQPEEFRSLAYVETTRSILVGCEGGKIIAFPLPRDEGNPATPSLAKVHSGSETPPSSRVGATERSDTFELHHRGAAA